MSSRTGISMRWWLALAFAAIAALTALSIAQVFNHRAEQALRSQGENLAVGQSSSAAYSLSNALAVGGTRDELAAIVDHLPFAVWAFSQDGTLLTSDVSRGAIFENVPEAQPVLAATLENGRQVVSLNGGKSYLVGLPLRDRRGVVVTFIQRPALEAQLGIVRDQLVRAALLAVLIAALVGLLVAMLIAARLRGIGRAAAAIEAGAFDAPLRPRFHDEVGALADTIDQMRVKLRESFSDLAAERDRLRQLFEGLHEGVIALDRELRIVFWNGAARAFFQEHPLRVGEPLPDPWRGFPIGSFAAELFDTAAVTQARVVDDEHVFSLTGIPARPGSSDAILVVADISESDRRERAEREFVTNAAHELGTPLTAIGAALDALQRGARNDPAERDFFLSLIERQTQRLGRLRRALLALARAQTRHEPLQLEPVPLAAILERVADEVGAGDIEVRIEADDDLAALTHPELVEQIVFNLVENALRHANATEIELGAFRRDSNLVTIVVRDDGGGIAIDQRDRLFDRFYRGSTESNDGFGLGLAIVRAAVHALDGTIEIDSSPRGGTVVSVVLAAAEVHVG